MPRPTTDPKDTDRRKRPAMYGVRLLPEEAAAVQALAESRQVSRAEVLRHALLRELREAGVVA